MNDSKDSSNSTSSISSSYSFLIISTKEDIKNFIEINKIYFDWVCKELNHYDIELLPMDENYADTLKTYVTEFALKLTKISPPEGIFYLIKNENLVVGMGGIRKIGSGVAEIKRVYVNPEHRGHKLGGKLINTLIENGRQFGYDRIKLDTAKFMATAQRIYKSFGFLEIDPYAESEVPPEYFQHTMFMELDLKKQR